MGILENDVVQVIEVPKISQDPIPQRMLTEPQLVEQLVSLPVPHLVTLARGQDAAGSVWYQLASRVQGIYWWKLGTRHTQLSSPEGLAASLGRVYKYWARVTWSTPCDHAARVSSSLREGEGAADSVPRQSVGHASCFTESGTLSVNLCTRP